MPPVVPWMTNTDRHILDLLGRAGIAVTPAVIWRNLRDELADDAPSERQISRRLRGQLTEHGLVSEPFDGVEGYYALSALGERYLHDDDAESEEFIVGLD